MEWGAGASTTLFYHLAKAHNAALFMTIEHNRDYLDSVVAGFDKADFFHPTYVSLSETSAQAENTSPYFYSTCPMVHHRPFDIIFVDGRIRNECLLMAALVASPEALVILHDFRRVRMTPAKFLFDSVDTSYRGALVLRRKSSLDAIAARFMNSLQFHEQSPPDNARTENTQVEKTALSSQDKKSFQKILKKHLSEPRQHVLEWGTQETTKLLLEHFTSAPEFFLSVKQTSQEAQEFVTLADESEFFEAPAVSLEGTRLQEHKTPISIFLRARFTIRKNTILFMLAAKEGMNAC